MKRTRNPGAHGLFLAAFAVLTLMTWSPLGYGAYGEVPRVLGMPRWAVVALAASVALFLLEWWFLFGTRLTLQDEDMEEIVPRLKAPATEAQAARKVVLR
ncbi:MAG: DUF997 domain-containing protein [Deferrisomatales bacterium]